MMETGVPRNIEQNNIYKNNQKNEICFFCLKVSERRSIFRLVAVRALHRPARRRHHLGHRAVGRGLSGETLPSTDSLQILPL